MLRFLSDFRKRCSTKLERLGDSAADAKQYNEAIPYYTSALSLNPTSQQHIIVKRSKAYLKTGLWKQALDDAEQVKLLRLMDVGVADPPSGDHARPVVTVGIRKEACGLTRGSRL